MAKRTRSGRHKMRACGNRTAILHVRLLEDEKADYEATARNLGYETLASWVRHVLKRAACESQS